MPVAGARPSSRRPLGVAHPGDDEYGKQHECHDGGQFGEQQVGPTHRPYKKIAQRAGLTLPGDGIASENSHGDRKQQRQYDTKRGEWEESAVVEDGRQERRTCARSRTKIGHG